MTYSSGLSRTDPAPPVWHGWSTDGFVRALGIATVAILLGTAGVLAWRRIAGALIAPLPFALLVLAGMVLLALTGLARLLFIRGDRERQGRGGERRAAHVLRSLAVLAVASSLSVPGSGWVGLIGLWGLVLLGEFLAWHPVLLSPQRWSRRAPRLPRIPRRFDAPQVPVPHAFPSETSLTEQQPGDEVLQQFTRRHLEEGIEELAGWLRVEFAPNQRTENVHVAFCPPFPASPQFSATQIGGPPARIKIAQLLPYGARLDLKLSGPAEEPTSVLVEFASRTS